MSSGEPVEGKQEGGPPLADRAGKGQEFPACEPRKGHCGSVGAKGQWGSPHEIEISLLLRELRVFTMSNPGNSGFIFPWLFSPAKYKFNFTKELRFCRLMRKSKPVGRGRNFFF